MDDVFKALADANRRRLLDRTRAEALADLTHALEQTSMNNRFVYTSYIRTTPEQLWTALTDPALTGRWSSGVRRVGTNRRTACR